MGRTGDTRGSVEVAELLVEYRWAGGTWRHRASQLGRWLAYCDEEGRTPLPAEEGDVLAYNVYLSLEGRVGPSSACQYFSAISRYHEDAGYSSPTGTQLMAILLKAYEKNRDRMDSSQKVQRGCQVAKCFGLSSWG